MSKFQVFDDNKSPSLLNTTLNELEIYPRVFLGGNDEAKDPTFFSKHFITHVLNVSPIQNYFEKKVLTYEVKQSINNNNNKQSPPLAVSDLENQNPNIINDNNTGNNNKKDGKKVEKKEVRVSYKKIKIDDSMDVKISKHFDKATEFIDNAIQSSESNHVLVHCKEGRSRSVCMLIAYGMKYHGLSLLDAYTNFQKRTNCRANMNLGFQLQLMELEKELSNEDEDSPSNTLDFLNNGQLMSIQRQVRKLNNDSLESSNALKNKLSTTSLVTSEMSSPTKKRKVGLMPSLNSTASSSTTGNKKITHLR
ncbi:hypothetical protein ABK040_014104 [Willaertia magna]